jgi:hypothetical protein
MLRRDGRKSVPQPRANFVITEAVSSQKSEVDAGRPGAAATAARLNSAEMVGLNPGRDNGQQPRPMMWQTRRVASVS